MASDEIGSLKIKIKGDTLEFDKSLDEVDEKASSFGEAFKNGLISAAASKAFDIATKAASKFASVISDSVNAFANYEQLVGGVDTLFKDASEAVITNASRAYETAGLSANDYMENVTAYSASLLQSLGGDTAKAAEIADMAIIDMADNANKMGTDMERITDAYQGFAKQNYTMLDNLKLGYGGTKGEMERLLADATALSGIEYDIDSLNDVFEAIHIIQGDLDITGTTALEASTTISGSANAMKAAWGNVLVGIGDDTQDFDKLLNNLVDTVTTFASNIMPTISVAISQVGSLVSKLAPVIAKELPKMISEVLPSLIEGLVDLTVEVAKALPDMLVTLIQTIIEVLPDVLSTLIEALPVILQSIVDGIMQLATMLTEPENLNMVLTAAVQLLMALVEALPQILAALTVALPQVINNIVNFLLDPANLMLIIVAAVELFMGLVKAIPQVLETLMGSLGGLLDAVLNNLFGWIGPLIGAGLQIAGDFIGSLLDGLASLPGKLWDVGKEIVHGLWEGISGAWDWIWQKITGFCNGIIDGIKSFFGIHSPSRLFEDEVGAMLAQGISVGFTGEMDDVNAEMTASLPNPAIDSMDGWHSAIDTIFVEDEVEMTAGAPVTIIQNNNVNSSLDIELVGDQLLEQMRRI